MRRNAAKVISAAQPVNWLGANFWSRTGGPLMWRNYDPAVIGAELGVLRDHGLSMTRSFFYWPDFMPAPDRIDEDLAGRFADFLDRHTALGMTTVPTFIVGHMSGENWDVPWRQGRDLYGDGWMLARQAFFARSMAERFGRHPAVVGWLLSNEMPLYGGPTDAEYARKLDELDRLLNDPDVPMEPAKVWSLLAEIAQRDRVSTHSGPSRD